MEDFLQTTSAPFHLLDIIVYNGTTFNPLLNEAKFLQKYQGEIDSDLSKAISKSIGVLYSTSYRASAFVVNTPNNFKTTEGSQIKALLLTAAHVFTNPLLDEQKSIEWFFSLAPDYTEEMKNPKYTSFKVHRVFAHSLFKSSKPQIDPITGSPYMLPDDVDIVMIIENDPKTIPRSEGNVLEALKYAKLPQEEQKQEQPHQVLDCFIIGYPSKLLEDNRGLWAPILSKEKDLAPITEDFYNLVSQRSFAPGHLKGRNETCAAITCSTWAGMSGGPLCQLSEDKKSLTFYGIYNGSAALPFQELVGRMLFAFKGYPIAFIKDIPVLRGGSKIEEYALFAEILTSILPVFTKKNFQDLSASLNLAIRQSLGSAEKYGINVEHNLAITGGCRFDEIIQGLDELEKAKNLSFNLKDLFKSFEPCEEIKVDIKSCDEDIEKLFYGMRDQTFKLASRTMAFEELIKSTSLEQAKRAYEKLEKQIDDHFKELQARFEKIKYKKIKSKKL